MRAKHNKEKDKIKRAAGFYNMFLNLLWSAVAFVPLTVFCYTRVDSTLLFVFAGCSIIPVFLSHTALEKLRISNKTATYKKLGVAWVQRLSQNGELVNRLLRKQFPDYRVVRPDKRSVQSLIKQTYVFEKFHLLLLVFFGLASGYALYQNLVGWAFSLGTINLLYNAYPVLLQQYLRLKLVSFIQKEKAPAPSAAGTFKYRLKCIG